MGAGSLKRESDRAQIPTWKLVALGTMVSFAATLVLSALGGVLTTLFTFRAEAIEAAIPIIGYCSAGIGGLYAGKRGGENGGRNGLVVGAVYFGLVLLISVAVVREPLGATSVIARGVSAMIVSSLGGIIGVNL